MARPPSPKHTAQGDTGKCVWTSTPACHRPGRPSLPALWDLLCNLLGALVSWKGGHLRVMTSCDQTTQSLL